jgi:hypothetical protein
VIFYIAQTHNFHIPMNTIPDQNLGFGSIHVLGFHFSGIFQLRLPTDIDPSDHPRGQDGWTFAYGNEPDLDRVIRFNNPVSPRSFTPDVGVFITDAYNDADPLDDSIVHQPVNLGPHSFFDGSNGANGHEPIVNFEFHAGSGEDYLNCRSSAPPVGQGIHDTRFPIPNLDDVVNSRMQLLQSSSNSIDQERLNNISRSLNLIYNFEVTYPCSLDSNIIFNPKDSGLIMAMQERQISSLSLIANFYGYDGDALLGYVNGEVSGTYR